MYADEDADYKYKLLDLSSWFEMVNARIRYIGKEFENKIDAMRSSAKLLPIATRDELNLLSGKSDEVQKYLLLEKTNNYKEEE